MAEKFNSSDEEVRSGEPVAEDKKVGTEGTRGEAENVSESTWSEVPECIALDPKKDHRRVIYTSIAVILIILLAVWFWGSYKQSSIETVSSDINVGELTHMTLAEKNELAQKIIDDSMFEISIETVPEYKDGKLGIGVENRDTNKIDIQIAVINSDGEEVYYSDILKPGSYIECATIDESKIESGKAQVRYDFLENGKVYQSSYVDIEIRK